MCHKEEISFREEPPDNIFMTLVRTSTARPAQALFIIFCQLYARFSSPFNPHVASFWGENILRAGLYLYRARRGKLVRTTSDAQSGCAEGSCVEGRSAMSVLRAAEVEPITGAAGGFSRWHGDAAFLHAERTNIASALEVAIYPRRAWATGPPTGFSRPLIM